MANPVLPVPLGSVPKFCIPDPMDHKKAVDLAPTTCPLELMPSATLALAPGREPISIMIRVV
jgi:hypothetical protein